MTEEQNNLPEAKETDSKMTTTRKGTSRYIARSVREFVKWAPSGAAGFPFLSFVLKQDWVLALMVFPVNIIAAV